MDLGSAIASFFRQDDSLSVMVVAVDAEGRTVGCDIVGWPVEP